MDANGNYWTTTCKQNNIPSIYLTNDENISFMAGFSAATEWLPLFVNILR